MVTKNHRKIMTLILGIIALDVFLSEQILEIKSFVEKKLCTIRENDFDDAIQELKMAKKESLKPSLKHF